MAEAKTAIEESSASKPEGEAITDPKSKAALVVVSLEIGRAHV